MGKNLPAAAGRFLPIPALQYFRFMFLCVIRGRFFISLFQYSDIPSFHSLPRGFARRAAQKPLGEDHFLEADVVLNVAEAVDGVAAAGDVIDT